MLSRTTSAPPGASNGDAARAAARPCARRLLPGWATLAALLAACSPPAGAAAGAGDSDAPAGRAAVVVVDDAGREVRLARPAARIVALLPAATETLLALGAAERLVARTDYDTAPELAHLPSVGGGLTPSVEYLASLRPDLVIAWEEAGTPRVRPRLEALGIAVFAVRTQDTTDIYANIARFGRLTGREAAADSLARHLRASLDSVRASVAGRPRPTVLFVGGVDPPLTAGPGTFIGQLIGVAGGELAFPELATNWPQLSPEAILRRRPEVLILPVGESEPRALERLRTSAGWRELLAAGRTRVHPVPADLINRSGPGIAEAARRLRDGIHPELAGVARP